MKQIALLQKTFVMVLLTIISSPANLFPQAATTIDTSKMSYNGISSSLGLYVFPSKNQSNQQQKADEFECYNWAMKQSGIDPQNMPNIKPDSAANGSGSNGTVVKSAAKGAVIGTAIGAVTGDAGTGAAVGAIAGGAGGMRKKRVTQRKQKENAQASVEKQEQDMLTSFKKAFSACIEGKGYTIK